MSPTTGIAAQFLDVLGDAISAIDDGRSVPEVMCLGMANLLGAAVAAFVRLNPSSRECSAICWPRSKEWAASSFVSHQPFQTQGEAGTWTRASGWRRNLVLGMEGDLIGLAEFAELKLACGGPEERLAVFARRERFREDDLRLLAACEGPLAAIDRHVLRLAVAEVTTAVEAPTASLSPESGFCRPGPALAATLTSREIEVLVLLRQGMKASAIAARLGVSPRTVSKHLGNAYRKLDAHDRLLAVRAAQSLGVLPRW